ncbi:MAG: MATE family efflux transporter [Pseudomonadota bacterium]
MLAEVKRIIILGLPLIAAMLLQMGMGVVSTIMVGRYDSVHLAGIAISGALFMPISMLFNGIFTAITPIVAQLHGAQRTDEVGEVLRQGFWLALVFASLLVVVLSFSETVFLRLGIEPKTAAIGAESISWTSIGIFPIMLFILLIGTCSALGRTRIAMFVSIFTFVVNIGLTYCLVYGEFGFPEMGGPGSALASAISLWGQVIILFFVTQQAWFKPVGLYKQFSPPNLKSLQRYLRLGVPIGLLRFVEIGFFSCISLLLAKIGPWAVASHQIAMNINSILFVVAMSLGTAASIAIGQYVGADKLNNAHLATRAIMLMTLIYSVCAALTLIPLRTTLVALHTSDTVVSDVTVSLLLFVVAYQLMNNSQVTATSALRGFKDTSSPVFIALGGYWLVGFPASLLLGNGSFGFPDWGIYGYWAGLCSALVFVAVVANIRLWRLSLNHERIRQLAHL